MPPACLVTAASPLRRLSQLGRPTGLSLIGLRKPRTFVSTSFAPKNRPTMRRRRHVSVGLWEEKTLLDGTRVAYVVRRRPLEPGRQ